MILVLFEELTKTWVPNLLTKNLIKLFGIFSIKDFNFGNLAFKYKSS